MTKLAKPTTSAIAPLAKAPQRAEYALLYHKEGQDYWVRGYELLDPLFEHSTRSGRKPLDTKALRPGHVFLMCRGQEGKPTQYHESRVSPVQPGKHYFTFQELYGGAGVSSITVIDAVIETEDEDLWMGLTVPVVVMEDDQ